MISIPKQTSVDQAPPYWKPSGDGHHIHTVCNVGGHAMCYPVKDIAADGRLSQTVVFEANGCKYEGVLRCPRPYCAWHDPDIILQNFRPSDFGPPSPLRGERAGERGPIISINP